jgi:hypothetical protein
LSQKPAFFRARNRQLKIERAWVEPAKSTLLFAELEEVSNAGWCRTQTGHPGLGIAQLVSDFYLDII